MKKILSFILAVCMIAAMLPLAVTAADKMTFTVGNTTVEEGATTATVDVTLANNPGFFMLGLQASYDDSFTLQKPVVGENFSDFGLTFGDVIIMDASDDIAADGTILSLTFKIAAGTAPGVYPITLEYVDEGALNLNEDSIPADFVPGSITVGTPKIDFPADIALGTKEFTYDGAAKSLTKDDITGTLPAGTSVTFEGDGVTDAGEYTVKATLTADGYNNKTVEGKIKINPKSINITGVDAYDRTYDGTNVVKFKPGTLEGVVAGDDVTAKWPETGTIPTPDATPNKNYHKLSHDPIVLEGDDAKNYTIGTVNSAWVDIRQKSITVTAVNDSKRIETADPDKFEYTYNEADIIDGATFTGSLVRDAGETAGKYAIKQGTLKLTDNYSINFVEGEFTILARNTQNSSVEAVSGKTYGDASFDLAYSKDEAVTDRTVTFESKTPNVVSVDNTGKVTVLNAGDAHIQVVFAGDVDYDTKTVDVKFNVAKRNVTYTADPVEAKVGDTEKTLTAKLTSGELAYDDADVVVLEREQGTAIGNYAITIKSVTIKNGAGEDKTANYNITKVGGVYKIVDKNVQNVFVTAPVNFKYGANRNPEILVALDEAAKADGCNTVTYTVASAAPEGCMTVDNHGRIIVNGAGTATFTVKVNGTTNYAEFTKNVTLTVAKREVIILPRESQFKYEGKDDPAKFEYTLGGDELLTSDTLTGELGRASGEAVGTYDYTLGTLYVNENYNITVDTTNKFEIKAASEQAVHFPAIPAKTYGDPVFNLGVSVTSYIEAEPSYDSSNKAVATVDGAGRVTILAAGETDITVSVPASVDGQFKAYSKTQKLTVNKVTLTVTPDAGQWKYVGQNDDDFTYTVTGKFVGSDTEATVISGSLTRAAGEAIGKYDYKLDSLNATANYKLVLGGNAQYEIKDKLATTVTLASAVTKTYGDAAFNVNAAITASKDGAATQYASDNEKVATVDADGNVTIVGAGTAKITVTVAGNEEYKDYTGTQTVTVGKKNVTVTAIATGKRVDTADPELSYNNTGLAYDDQFAGKLVRDAGEAIKDYDIKQGTLKIVGADGTTDKSANYNLTFVGAKFTISDKLPQSVTVPAVPTKTYGDESFSVKATIVTSYEGATAEYASSNTAVATVDNDGNVTILAAGTAEITVTVAGNDDYAKFEFKQPLTVNKKQITVTPADGQWKRIGKADPEFTYSYDESLIIDDAVITGKLGRAEGEEPGVYAYTLGTLTAGANYELVLGGDAKFEIKDKMEQDVEMPELPGKITYGDGKHSFKPTRHPIENHSIRYETSDDKIARVDENGDLIFVGAGVADITVIIDGNDDYKPYTETFKVKVNRKQIKIKDFDPVNKTITFEDGSFVGADEVGLDTDALEVNIVTVPKEGGGTKTVVTFSNVMADDPNYLAVTEIDDSYVDPDPVVPDDPDEPGTEPDDPDQPPVDPDEPVQPQAPVVTLPPIELDEDDDSDLANSLREQIVTVTVDSPFGTVTRNGEKVDKTFQTLEGITETLTVTPNKNYKFNNWTIGGTNYLTETVSFTATADMTVRASFTEIVEIPIIIPEYSVIFESNGGTYIPSVKVEEGNRVERPEDPERAGYIFDGWYSDIYLDEEFSFRTEIYEFTVLFAKWIKVEVPETEEPEVPVTPVEPEIPEEPKWQNPFTDVNPADWFYSVVEYVNSKGIMNGVDATLFAPNGQVTRAMFVTMLHRLEGAPTAAQSTFTDVELNAWYTAAINWASANGIVNGTSETTFAPNAAITREQMAAILYRYASYKKYDVTVKDTALTFTDADAISDYAMTAIVWAVENGLMQGNGDNTVAPKNAATRAEAAAVLMRAIENIK